MALIFSESKCAICGGGFPPDSAQFATTAFLDPAHPLWAYSDAPMHWDCYAQWPHRLEFARAYFDMWVEHEKQNPYWGVALMTDAVAVTVNPRPPVSMVSVRLAETGCGPRIPVADWDTWITDLDSASAGLHPLEQQTLRRVWPDLLARVPNIATVVSNVDWDEKKHLLEEWHAYNRSSNEERLSKIRHHNKACRQMVRTGAACPFCDEPVNIRYLDKSPDKKSYFICNACARSFGPVDEAMRDMEREREDGTGP